MACLSSPVTCLVAAAVIALAAAVPVRAQSLPEEFRFQGELQACRQQPDSMREACERLVQAKIKAAWTARIEAESRRRTSK